jgi:hypothetical protein
MTRIETRWQALPWVLRWSIFLAVSVLILFLRSPGLLLGAEFLSEDGQTFFLGTYFGSPLDVILRSYAGYIHLVPRLVAYGERAVPIALAPLVSNLVSLLIISAVAAFIASNRLTRAAPHRGFRYLLALLLLLLPAQTDLYGRIQNAQWFLGLFMVCVLLAEDPRSRLATIAERISLLLAALSGPFGLLLSPLFVWRALRERSRNAFWSAACVVIPSLLQLLAVLESAATRRPPLGTYSVRDILGIISARVITEPILGARPVLVLETIFRYTFVSIPWITIAVIGIGVLGLGMMLWKLWRAFSENTPRWTLLVIGYTAAIMTTVGILFNPFRTGAADAYNSQRYFFFIGFAVATIVLGGALRLPQKRRVLKYVAISLLSIGIVCDFILPG